MVNLMRAKDVSRGGHGREELAQHTDENGWFGAVALNHLSENMLRQKADAVGKEAKEQTHEKVSHGLRVMAALLKAGGELGKLHRRRFSDTGGGAFRA